MLNVLPVMGWIVECDRILSPGGTSMLRDNGISPEQENIDRHRYVKCLDHLLTILDIEFSDRPLTSVQLLSWLALQIAINDREDEPFPSGPDIGRTVAITVHKAKGLEFDFVLIPETGRRFEFPRNRETRVAVIREANKKPSILWKWNPKDASEYTNVDKSKNHLWSVDDEESAREETRLLYVAMTRAKTNLLIYLPLSQKKSSGSPKSWADLIGLIG
jgi:ATP-dependent exoDNAse (exonuclease V) beta subunit